MYNVKHTSESFTVFDVVSNVTKPMVAELTAHAGINVFEVL